METASDDWFADLDDDGLPNMAVGRIPVRTPEDIAAVVTKILGYEKALQMDHATMVADKLGSFDFDYAEASHQVEALLPSSIVAEEIFRGDFASNEEAKEALITSINEGRFL